MSGMRWIGAVLRPLRPGVDALTSSKLDGPVARTTKVTSPVFKESEPIPRMFTADGEGRFPGVEWADLPPQTESLVLLVEDADIPLLYPVTHLIVHSIPPSVSGIETGAVRRRMAGPSPQGWACGRNFLGAAGWTPPAPPPGHGPHRYAFQVFALDAAPHFRYPPSRRGLIRRIQPHIVAQGRLFGTYVKG